MLCVLRRRSRKRATATAAEEDTVKAGTELDAVTWCGVEGGWDDRCRHGANSQRVFAAYMIIPGWRREGGGGVEERPMALKITRES